MKRLSSSRILVTLTLAATVLIVIGQSTKRRGIKPTVGMVEASAVATGLDTVVGAEAIDGIVRLTDFNKTTASRVESLMITNISETDTVRAVTVDIDYKNLQGRQLNRRIVTFEVTVPPGETRHASVASWDRQQLFYYKNTPPARKTQRTTAFDITIEPVSIILARP